MIVLKLQYKSNQNYENSCFIDIPDGGPLPYEQAGVREIKAKYSWPAILRADFLPSEWKLGRGKEPVTFRGTHMEFSLSNTELRWTEMPVTLPFQGDIDIFDCELEREILIFLLTLVNM